VQSRILGRETYRTLIRGVAYDIDTEADAPSRVAGHDGLISGFVLGNEGEQETGEKK
jgi:hypothetical protein